MPVTLSNLVAALDEFPRYHAIGVFADDLGELQERPLPASFRPLDGQGRGFLVSYQGRAFRLDVFPEQGVARLSKNGVAGDVTGVDGGLATSGAVGATLFPSRTPPPTEVYDFPPTPTYEPTWTPVP